MILLELMNNFGHYKKNLSVCFLGYWLNSSVVIWCSCCPSFLPTCLLFLIVVSPHCLVIAACFSVLSKTRNEGLALLHIALLFLTVLLLVVVGLPAEVVVSVSLLVKRLIQMSCDEAKKLLRCWFHGFEGFYWCWLSENFLGCETGPVLSQTQARKSVFSFTALF